MWPNPFFAKIIILTVGKNSTKMWATFVISGKLHKLNNRPMGENSTNLVTLSPSCFVCKNQYPQSECISVSEYLKDTFLNIFGQMPSFRWNNTNTMFSLRNRVPLRDSNQCPSVPEVICIANAPGPRQGLKDSFQNWVGWIFRILLLHLHKTYILYTFLVFLNNVHM
jgi:hypothetical protein